MKRIVILLAAALFSIVMGLFLPTLLDNKNYSIEDLSNSSIIDQKVIGYSDTNTTICKIYDSGKFIGVVTNLNKIKKDIKEIDFNTDYEYEKKEVGFTEDVYVVNELSNLVYEDIDNNIVDYLFKNDLIGVEAIRVEIINDEGLLRGMMYIDDEADFDQAKNEFILNFISQESLNRINNGDKITSPESLGSVDMGINIKEKINVTKSIVPPNKILKDVDEIYDYLCYGDNEDRQYYTTKQGDTLAGVGRFFSGMNARQVMMINKKTIKDENQLIPEGTVLNVTYYSSPITVTVSKERLAQEITFPDGEPVYQEDSSLAMGQTLVSQEEENGLKNVLYSEIWENGILKSGTNIREDVLIQSKSKIIKVGTGTIVSSGSAGTGNWRWPVSNPSITCDFYCYANHGGVDFYNLYKPWDYVLAVDNGVVIDKGWTNLGGYYCRIDHNNGYITYYGHFSSLPYVEEGQNVVAGEILGPIGMTGNATGPHVHLAMYVNDVLINPCTVLNCSLLY